MANAITVNSVERGIEQFRGMFSEMWQVTATITDQDAVAIGDTGTYSVTVPGVALGDMVVGLSFSLDTSDGTDFAIPYAEATAANTITLRFNADAGELAADSMNNAIVKMLIGRPAW